MGEIIDVIAREILDSRGNPTVEAEVFLETGVFGHCRGSLGSLDRLARSSGAA